MTPRRSFFRSLALLSGAAVGCPGIFIPKFEPVRWKRERLNTRFLTEQDVRQGWFLAMTLVPKFGWTMTDGPLVPHGPMVEQQFVVYINNGKPVLWDSLTTT